MNPSFTSSISLIASPARVMSAIFDPRALALWWQTTRSVTVPRVLGAYALEWEPTEFADEMLGPTLLSLHNVAFYLRLMAEARHAIAERRFASFHAVCLARWGRSA